jgi:hypothetical protein
MWCVEDLMELESTGIILVNILIQCFRKLTLKGKTRPLIHERTLDVSGLTKSLFLFEHVSGEAREKGLRAGLVYLGFFKWSQPCQSNF